MAGVSVVRSRYICSEEGKNVFTEQVPRGLPVLSVLAFSCSVVDIDAKRSVFVTLCRVGVA